MLAPVLALAVWADPGAPVATIVLGEPDSAARSSLESRARAALETAGFAHVSVSYRKDAKRIEAEPALAAAAQRIEKAKAAFRGFKLAPAKVEIEAAAKEIEPYAGLPVARELDRNALAWGASIAHAQRDEVALLRVLQAYASRFAGEPPPDDAGWPPAIRKKLDEISAKSMGNVQIVSSPPAAAFLDGKSLGTTPASAKAALGPHRVWIELAGHVPVDESFVLSSNEWKVEAKLLLDGASLDAATFPLPQSSFATISAAAPGATFVFVDARGKKVHKVDAQGASEAAYETVEGSFEAAVVGLFEESKSSGEVPLWAVAAIAAGGAAVGVGTYVRVDAANAQDDILIRAPALTQREAMQLDDDAHGQATLGTVLIGVGIAGIAGVAGWWFVENVL